MSSRWPVGHYLFPSKWRRRISSMRGHSDVIVIIKTGKFLKYNVRRTSNTALNGHCYGLAKLGDLSRVTLYSAWLPGWLNMRVTSQQHVPWVICMPWRQEMFLFSQRNICCLLLQILSYATKFRRWLNWEALGNTCSVTLGDTLQYETRDIVTRIFSNPERPVEHNVARDMSPSLAKGYG